MRFRIPACREKQVFQSAFIWATWLPAAWSNCEGFTASVFKEKGSRKTGAPAKKLCLYLVPRNLFYLSWNLDVYQSCYCMSWKRLWEEQSVARFSGTQSQPTFKYLEHNWCGSRGISLCSSEVESQEKRNCRQDSCRNNHWVYWEQKDKTGKEKSPRG